MYLFAHPYRYRQYIFLLSHIFARDLLSVTLLRGWMTFRLSPVISIHRRRRSCMIGRMSSMILSWFPMCFGTRLTSSTKRRLACKCITHFIPVRRRIVAPPYSECLSDLRSQDDESVLTISTRLEDFRCRRTLWHLDCHRIYSFASHATANHVAG